MKETYIAVCLNCNRIVLASLMDRASQSDIETIGAMIGSGYTVTIAEGIPDQFELGKCRCIRAERTEASMKRWK